jgi:hypothetical protein
MIAFLLMHWLYLKAVLRHKRFVYEEGRKLGLSIWQCLIHDWSKFTPRMWGPYARAFYGPKNQKTGKPDGRPDFDAAWLFHQHIERHHWQHYVLMEDSGKVHCLPMPEKYRREMLADWRGANRAYGDTPLIDWYLKTLAARKLHPETQIWIEQQLGIIFVPAA